MARHLQFTTATDMPVFFCDPHSPWQRGSNENTNGLLRQYFPKSTDLKIHTADHLAAVPVWVTALRWLLYVGGRVRGGSWCCRFR